MICYALNAHVFGANAQRLRMQFGVLAFHGETLYLARRFCGLRGPLAFRVLINLCWFRSWRQSESFGLLKRGLYAWDAYVEERHSITS